MKVRKSLNSKTRRLSGLQPNPYEQYIYLEELLSCVELNDGSTAQRMALVNALHALEISAMLVADNAKESRATIASMTPQRQRKLLQNIQLQMTCLETLMQGYQLEPQDQAADAHAEVTTFWDILAPFKHNLDQHLSELSFSITAATPSNDHSKPVLAYAKLVQRSKLSEMLHRVDYGIEHGLFMATHQIVEMWVHIADRYIGEAELCLKEQQLKDASRYLVQANQCIEVVTSVSEQLNLMNNADYHPLRVKLRDASGAQSRKTRGLKGLAKRCFKSFQALLEQRQLTLLLVLVDSDKYFEEYEMIMAFKDHSRIVQGFFFHHYLLLLSVLGVQNYGSIGYKVSDLVKPCADPIFPDLNAVLFEFTVLTNFQYLNSSGAITYSNALEHGTAVPAFTLKDLDGISVDPDVMKEKVEAYSTAINQADRAGWAKLFHREKGCFLDHPDAKPYVGITQLGVFIKSFLGSLNDVESSYKITEIREHEIDVDWHMKARFNDRVPLDFTAVEKFAFTSDGQIARVESEWDSAALAEHILEAERRSVAHN